MQAVLSRNGYKTVLKKGRVRVVLVDGAIESSFLAFWNAKRRGVKETVVTAENEKGLGQKGACDDNASVTLNLS